MRTHNPRRLALLIGNQAYADAKLSDMAVAAADVRDLGAVLGDREIGGFDAVEALIDAKQPDIEAAIRRLFKGRTSDDLLLLYFSGHGLKDSKGGLYLALFDTEEDWPLARSLSADYLKTAMNLSHSRRQVLILDCCFSGAFAGDGGKAPGLGEPVVAAETFDTGGYGSIVLMSSSKVQQSWPDAGSGPRPERSLFTHFLVEGLRTRAIAPSWASIRKY